MTTLVIGARGSIGRHVLDQLHTAGDPVRAGVRHLSTAGELPAGVPVVRADLTRPETLGPALDGVRRVFVYALPADPAPFAAAVAAAGVEHVVLLSSGSVLLPWTATNAIAREHREVEAALPGCVPIRPLVLANNALAWARSIRAEGVVRVAHPAAATAPIHERDIAAVAVAALRDPSTPGVSDLLTGPDALTRHEQVRAIAAAAGRPIRIEELTPAAARAAFAAFTDAATAAAILEFVRHALEPGGSPVTGTFTRVTGRRPASFAQWARDHAAEFQGGV
ncbi:SDR family oxidoreductase [Dactylosporangium sp. CA-052675]|uniref:SDR family oxidoreductase n=1 Tax=Dactylosporangium sp. CA-052675 TaxID=3239927 RepID=UPI003D905E13